jgi:hypothetical protein
MVENRGGVWTPASATPQFSQDLPKTMDGAIPVHQVFTKLFHLLVAASSVHWAITWINFLPLFVTHAPKDFTTMLRDEVPVLFVLLVVLATNRHKKRWVSAKAAMQENTHPHPTLPPALIAHRAQTTKILKVWHQNTTNAPIAVIALLENPVNFMLILVNASNVHPPETQESPSATGAVLATTSIQRQLQTTTMTKIVNYAHQGIIQTTLILACVIFVLQGTMEKAAVHSCFASHATGVNMAQTSRPSLNWSARIAQWDFIQKLKHWQMQTNARLARKDNGVLHQGQQKIPCVPIVKLENTAIHHLVLLLKARVKSAELENI